MGSVSLKIGDGTARFHCATFCSSALQLLMLASVIPTNLFALYAFSFSPSPFATADVGDHKNLSVISKHVSLILREIEASERRLHQIERELAGYETLDPAKPGLPPELKLVLARHPLPFGRDSRSGITTMVSSVTHSCARPAAVTLLSKFMSYRHAACCPTADPLLLSKLSSPRPASPSPAAAAPRLPLPRSLWNPNAKNPLPPCGPCRAGTPRPCRAGTPGPCLPRLGPGRAVPGLVRGPNFSSPARPLLMSRAKHGPVL